MKKEKLFTITSTFILLISAAVAAKENKKIDGYYYMTWGGSYISTPINVCFSGANYCTLVITGVAFPVYYLTTYHHYIRAEKP